ncbi:hypothetical protein M6B38_247730 [Iris pallida]|uniref:Uncharacterized protein n=1 Tax=Iris pallida TaxID=29817 RepID=A0AAX6DG13_IRIPA|nr:hypothetical protein M6B38_247730 [Iris pallida]
MGGQISSIARVLQQTTQSSESIQFLFLSGGRSINIGSIESRVRRQDLSCRPQKCLDPVEFSFRYTHYLSI